jgi:tetratricopeptide (TPR) repeat protein
MRPAARRDVVAFGTIATIWLVAVPVVAETSPPTLDDCDARVRDAPDVADSYYCYTISVRSHGQADDAVRRLEAILAIRPDRHRARLNLAIIEESRGSPRTESLYREAVDGMEAEGDHSGAVYGGTALAYRLGKGGEAGQARAELVRALKAAEATGDPMLVAWVWHAQALQALNESDYGRALRLYRKAEAVAIPDGRFDLQCRILSGLGSVLWYFRDLRGAMEVYRREAELRRQRGDLYGEASPRYNIALLATEFAEQSELEEKEIRAIQLDALNAAILAGDLNVEARTRLLLVERKKGADVIAEAERALELARMEGDLSVQLLAKRRIADATADLGPDRVAEALRLTEAAIAEARELGSLFDEARGLISWAYILAVHRSPREAIPAYLEALDVVERIRQLQPEETIRAHVFSRWNYTYYRLSGHLLSGLQRSADPDGDTDLAFRTMERLRARTLLDTLEASGAFVVPRDEQLREERSGILRRISETQKSLIRPDLPGTAREELLAELASLEIEEADVRDRIARTDRGFAALHAPDIPSLERIQGALGEGEALFSFQLWGRNDIPARDLDIGASWLIVATREAVEVFAIPDRLLIRDQVEIYEGLLANRDGSEAHAAEILYEGLLQEAVESLPDRIRNLVIIPDGALHRLPFSTLRARPGSDPVARRYDISIVPSAAVWLSWRLGGAEELIPSRALVLADPDLSGVSEADPLRTADPWVEGLRLGRLPHAVEEAHAMVRGVGGGSRLWTRIEASEHGLKQTDLDRFGILHFAAHAVVDDDRPERSAILLAPGGGTEDGLLQVREIVELDLDGQVVILTGCRSASGAVLEGEGVMGLARAFFRAGASTVIGGLWPLRDDDTALLMEEFSRRLGKGESVGSALAEATRARIAAGAPAAAWGGLVVLGDADVVPVPGGRPGGLQWVGWGAALLVTLLLLWVVRRRYSHRAGGS